MSEDADDDKVGYGNPPKQHRFPKGRSGNPKGRPRSKPPAPDLVALLAEPVAVRGAPGGKMHGFEAALRAQVKLALQGNVPAIRSFLEACAFHGVLKEFTEPPGGGVIRYPYDVKDVQAWIKQGMPGARDGAKEVALREREKARQMRDARRRKPAPADLVHRVAFELHVIEKGGRRRRVSTLEIIILRLKQAALEGKSAAFKLMRQLLIEHDSRSPEGDGGGVILVPECAPVEAWIREQIELNRTRKPPEGYRPLGAPPASSEEN